MDAKPALAASIVIRTSQPNPAASGTRAAAPQATARAARRAARASRRPARSPSSSRAARFAMPKPPPFFSANAAIVRSAAPSSSVRELAGEIGVAEQQRPGRSRALALRTAPGPCPGAAGARRRHLQLRLRRPSRPRAVVGDDHLGVGKLARAAPRRSRRCVLLVARSDEDRQRLIHRPSPGQRCDRSGSRAFADPSCRSCRFNADPRASATSASLPICMSMSSTVDRPAFLNAPIDRRRPPCPPTPISGNAGVREARIEPLEEDGGRTGLRLRGSDDHDAVDRALGRPDRLLDD